MEENEKILVNIIAEQTQILFKNIEDQINGAELERLFENVNNSRYLFHLIHSADKYFINPYTYTYNPEAAGGIDENYSIISQSRDGYIPDDGFVIPRETLAAYLAFVKQKVISYIENLTDNELSQKPENCPYTKLALILGQYRHTMFHCGMCETFTFDSTGKWLLYTGFKYLSNQKQM